MGVQFKILPATNNRSQDIEIIDQKFQVFHFMSLFSTSVRQDGG